MKDNLIICKKCNGNACYEIKQEDSITWMCLGCGFSSNSSYNIHYKSFDINKVEETIPELYKDIKFIDNDGYVWYPFVINKEGRGTVFPDGTSKDNWKWSALLSVPVTEEEKEKFVNPKGGHYLFKTDNKSLKQFEQIDFIEALDYVKFFEK